MFLFTSRAYLQTCQRSKMELSVKILSVRYLLLQEAPSYMFDRLLNTPLNKQHIIVHRKKNHCTVVTFKCKLLLRIEVYTYYCSFRKKKKKRAHGRTCKTHKGIELLKHLNRNWALEALKLIQTRKAIQSPKLTAVLLDTFEVFSKFLRFLAPWL